MEQPPGGPPDFTPPIILLLTPDSGAVVDGFDDDFEIQFDEVIDERSGRGLENLVLVSPRAEEVKVSWKRTRVTAKPKGGWRPNTVYHVVVLPGFADLRSNRLDTTFTIVFSTGGPIPDTRLSGTVVNWEEGRIGAGAVVEAMLLPDSLAYITVADSVGNFELTAVPVGAYTVSAIIDENQNRERDFRERFDSVAVTLDSTFSHTFWAFAHDTNGPQVRVVTPIDSVTARVDFNQMLAPGTPDTSVLGAFLLPDTVAVALHAIWTEAVYDSVSAIEAAIADSIQRTADSIQRAEEADSAGAGERAEPRDSVSARDSLVAEGEAAPPDTSEIERLLAERPRLRATLFLRFLSAVAPGGRYLIRARATNVSGATAESEAVLIVPEASDST